MVNVSKNQLDPKHLATLFSQLNTIVSRLNEVQADAFLTELLGPEERIMLAKRLATIIMLHEGYSQYRIAESLKLSGSTVSAITERYHRGDFKRIHTLFKKEPVTFTDFIETLDQVLHLGFLPRKYSARDRWKFLKH